MTIKDGFGDVPDNSVLPEWYVFIIMVVVMLGCTVLIGGF